MKKTVLTLIGIFILFFYLPADVYIKSQMHTDAMQIMGQSQPATDAEVVQWIGKDKMAQVSNKLSTIVDMTRKMIYVISPSDKTYVETSYPIDMSKLIDPQYAQMLSMMKMSIKVTPNGQTQKIGQWNCTGYDMDFTMPMAAIKSKVWATTDVSFDWKLFGEIAANSMLQILDSASIEEMKKIKGIQILTEASMEIMGSKMNSFTKVLEISQKTAPPDIYTVPAGYTKKDTIDLRKLQRQ